MKIPGSLALTLILLSPGAGESRQTEETVLGKPSAIQPSKSDQETLALEAGSRLREQPRTDAPVLEILTTSLELPVLDRQGSWVKVRFGTWQGWVQRSDKGPDAGQELTVSFMPDEQRLLRARSILGTEVEPRTLGPFTLYSDVADDKLLDWLSVVARDVLRAYRERFGLDPEADAREVLVIFAEETDYRRFEAAEERIAKADSRGYTSEGLSVLFTGEHTKTSLVSVFIHELTHLLSRRVFLAEVAPWLEEGMAEDLAFSRVTAEGRIRLGTLAGVQYQGLDERLPPSGPGAHLAALIASWAGPTRFDLPSLVAMHWEEFIQPDSRALNYAASAMLLRYFSDGGEEDLRQGFLLYVAAVSEAQLPATVSLWKTLGASPGEVEEGFFRFVQGQARARGIR